jgi:hypothetical protein
MVNPFLEGPTGSYQLGTIDGSKDAQSSKVTQNNQLANVNHNCLKVHSNSLILKVHLNYCSGYFDGYEDELNDRFSAP